LGQLKDLEISKYKRFFSLATLGEVYSLQHYVIKFVTDLRQVGDFPWVLPFPPQIKLIVTI